MELSQLPRKKGTVRRGRQKTGAWMNPRSARRWALGAPASGLRGRGRSAVPSTPALRLLCAPRLRPGRWALLPGCRKLVPEAGPARTAAADRTAGLGDFILA